MLLNKTVILTGATRGLGRAIAATLSAQGAHLITVARDREALQVQATALQGAHGNSVHPIACDLADRAKVDQLCDGLQNAGEIDILINNAGFGLYKPFTTYSAAEHDALLDVNLRAPVQICGAVVPGMIERGAGHILNVGSDVGLRPIGNLATYAATKYAMRGFSHSLSQEVRPHGVRVTYLAPGVIDTGFNNGVEGSVDGNGALEPQDLASLVLQVLTQPGHQLVDELVVHPMGQDY